jgi:hypothetical protein
MDVHEVIQTRRSVRSYRGDPIPEEVLNRVLEAARVAPSAGNGQPTRLVLVTEPEARRELAALCGNQSFVAEAPVVVVACGRNLHLNSATEGPNLWVLVDGAIALDHLTLAARAEGLGTCWIGVIGSMEVKQFVGLSEDTWLASPRLATPPPRTPSAPPARTCRWRSSRGGSAGRSYPYRPPVKPAPGTTDSGYSLGSASVAGAPSWVIVRRLFPDTRVTASRLAA